MTSADLAALSFSRSASVVAKILRHAHEVPDEIAVSFRGRDTSWAVFASQIRRTAQDLRERGVGRGDRVAVLLTNRPEFLVLVQAASAIGAIIVPINFRLSSGEVAFILDNVTPDLLFTEESLAELAAGAVAAATASPEVIDCDAVDLLETAERVELADAELVSPASGDDFAIMHTSGTTGNPKGAVLSHGNIFACSAQVANRWGIKSGQGVVMLAPPLFHIGAFLGCHGALAGGGTALVIPSAGFDPAETLATMKRFAVTATFMVPQQWQLLCEEIERSGGEGLALTHANWGGAPASEKLLERMKGALPGAEVKAAFGQTETTGYGVGLEFEDSLVRIGSVGKPTDDTAIRVVDPQMNDVGVDEVGEIVYRGPCVMDRYWNNETATAEAFHGGWFHSGDLVRRDADGFIYVVDRLKDMIISGGENIYCAEIENALTWHPQISEISIVGRPDETWGEVPIACIVPKNPDDPPTLASVRDYLTDRLASYKHPKDIRILDTFPRSGIGKIQKTVLRDRVQ
ncbi:AMP-binding protein [Brevibacterium sp. CS2]|uniref:AMP-binding protein n=1 Tax=Brevibacterium sp. CS2 TaxID=2575923 RepID=UPI0010C793E5|nr:AMP-binding protein [Brevibacterium sp. CS2]QCP06165.1 long-chain fatty acid--CoA ligase [Brevibacterium sp. CS2]